MHKFHGSQEYFLHIMRRLESDHGADFWARNRVPEC
jgi:hypothetical protein